jgi:hypothetical protein
MQIHDIRIYKCEACGCECTYDQLKKNYYYCDQWCPNCGDEKIAYARSRPAMLGSVAVFFTDRAYGGPEEGGWWDDTGRVDPQSIRCYEAGDFPAMQSYIELLRMRYPEKNARVYTYSEKIPPMFFPINRPFYH